MVASRLILRSLSAIALPAMLRAQAAVEYAAQSSAVAAAGSGMHLGACAVDSMLVSCVKHFYPLAFYTAIIASCLALGVLVFPKSKA
jgi:hypothetical protein